MRYARTLLIAALITSCAAIWWFAGLYLYLSPNLPEAETLRDVRLKTPLRILSEDGKLMGQFGEEKRQPLLFNQIPQQFVEALLAAEDDQFFEHGGVDLLGLGRAVAELVTTGQKRSGGSTLTMQVARNYFLSLERTFLRKFNEILLSLEIERALTKQEIFELYVNRVFLGHRSYGFESAAQTYYGKSLKDLNLAQLAMLAGVPKAPSNNNPLSNPEAGKERRDWILGRMAKLGFISNVERDAAMAEPVTAAYHGLLVEVEADYVAEMVRQEMLTLFGNSAYSDGYVVHTTVVAELQEAARDALVNGLKTYDRRHGWRGPEQRLPPKDDENPQERLERWLDALDNMPIIAGLPPAIVTGVDLQGANVIDKSGELRRLSWQNDLSKVRRYQTENLTAPVSRVDELLAVGDMVRIERRDEQWRLAQVPRAQAALVSIDAKTGAIRALSGGMGFELSKFNRATQARRQPGSNFKPFLYAAALESGITPATLINDAPIVLDDLSNDEIWRPENDSGRFYGPTRLRDALTFSRNLVSIRVLQRLGVRRFIDYVAELGFDTSDMAANLTLALGTHAYTPLEVVSGYATLANGGYRIEPYLIERIENAQGHVIFQADPLTACADCSSQTDVVNEEPTRMEDILGGNEEPSTRAAQQVMDPRAAYIVRSMLGDVISRGTGRRARVLERSDIAGKTGTTNGPRDAWFSGFNRQLATTAWVGFDDYSVLGRREFGGTAALPIWIEFMGKALGPELPPDPMPPGVVRLRIDRERGLRVKGAPDGSMLEYFLEEFIPAASSDDEQPLGTDELRGLF